MTRFRACRLALPVVLAASAASAKNDIRGVAVAQPLSDALETLELDGAQCVQAMREQPVTCAYDERTKLTLYVARAPPNLVQKLVYTFHFADAKAMRAKLSRLYGLRVDKVEGEHRLPTGEQLVVEFEGGGAGSLSLLGPLPKPKTKPPPPRPR